MSRAREELELRKQLLVTRASVQRLRVAQQMAVLHEELRVGRLARGVLRSRQARSVLLALAAMAAGRSRFRRLVRVLRIASLVLGAAAATRPLWAGTAPHDGDAPPPG